MIVLDTVKGRGCSFAEFEDFNHYMVIDHEMAKEAIEVIEESLIFSEGEK